MKLDGDETGLDCGGSCPVKCEKGFACRSDADCAPGLACVASQPNGFTWCQ